MPLQLCGRKGSACHCWWSDGISDVYESAVEGASTPRGQLLWQAPWHEGSVLPLQRGHPSPEACQEGLSPGMGPGRRGERSACLSSSGPLGESSPVLPTTLKSHIPGLRKLVGAIQQCRQKTSALTRAWQWQVGLIKEEAIQEGEWQYWESHRTRGGM